MNRRQAWACLAEMAESNDPEVQRRLQMWLAEKSEAIRQRKAKRRAGLFLVPKPAPKPEQLDLDFDAEDQREIERTISAVLEKQQREIKRRKF